MDALTPPIHIYKFTHFGFSLPMISNLKEVGCLGSSGCLITLFPAKGMVPVGRLSYMTKIHCRTKASEVSYGTEPGDIEL